MKKIMFALIMTIIAPILVHAETVTAKLSDMHSFKCIVTVINEQTKQKISADWSTNAYKGDDKILQRIWRATAYE